MLKNTEIRPADIALKDEVNFSEYLSIIVEGWRLILFVTLFLIFIGATYAFLSSPVYEADALIQVEDSPDTANGMLGTLASVFDTKATAAAEIEIIKSRLVVGETVRKLHLDIDAQPKYFPIIGRIYSRFSGEKEVASAPFGLTGFAWGGERIVVSHFELPRTLYDKKFVLTARQNGSFEINDPDGLELGRGGVGRDENYSAGYGRVVIRVDQLIARPGTRFVITRSSTFETIDNLQDKLQVSEKAKQSGIIGIVLDGGDSARTSSIVNTIANEYVLQNVGRKSSEAEHTLAFLDQQLPQLRSELDSAEEKYNAFRNKNGTLDLSEESRLLLQQIVDNKTKIVSLETQKQELAQRFTSSHPAIAAIDAQIVMLRDQQDSFSKGVGKLPNTEQTALRLLRDVRVNTELYTNLLNSTQQLRIVKAGQIGNVRVVDYAVVADEPERPKKLLVILLSVTVGLIFGVLAAFTSRALRPGVENTEEIEQVLGLAVYAVVPHSETQRQLLQVARRGNSGSRILATTAPEDVAVEGVRSLRTALQFALLEARNNIVMITGPRPEVGKSFLSVNLAAVMAAAGSRVLLIDADMRRGDVHEYFGIPRQQGLSDVIAASSSVKDALRTVSPNLDVLVKGALPPNPAELLSSNRFKKLLSELAPQYDIVIIDTPPILAVTDAALVGAHAGTSLLVVRHGRHPLPEIGEAAKRLRTSGIDLKGTIFTDVPQRRLGTGAYYTGYYGYESTEN